MSEKHIIQSDSLLDLYAISGSLIRNGLNFEFRAPSNSLIVEAQNAQMDKFIQILSHYGVCAKKLDDQ